MGFNLNHMSASGNRTETIGSVSHGVVFLTGAMGLGVPATAGGDLSMSWPGSDAAFFVSGSTADGSSTSAVFGGHATISGAMVVKDGISAGDGTALSLDGASGINIGTDASVAVDFNASTLDIDSTSTLTIDSATTVAVKGATGASFGDDTGTWEFDGAGAVSETGMTTFSLTPSSTVDIDAGGALTLDGSSITIGGDSDVAIDMDASTFDVDASGALNIDSATSISMGTTADVAWDIDTSTLDIDSSGAITIDGTSTVSIDGAGATNLSTSSGALTLAGESLDVDATNGNANIDATGTVAVGGSNATAVTLGRSGQTVTVAGNLDVNGTTTTVDSTNTTIEDRIIGLGVSGSNGNYSNLETGVVFGYGAKSSEQALLWYDGSRFALGQSPTSPSSGSIGTVSAYDKLMLGRLEIDSAADYIDVSTDMQLVAAADILLDPAGGDVKVDGNMLPNSANGGTLGSAAAEWSDLYMADGSVAYFGADQDVTLTHVADTGLLLNSDMEFQFRDNALTIGSSADGQLDIDADVELEITAPTVDINASTEVNISAACKVGGALTPNTADGSALGSAALEWSDLYLADSSVMYFGADQDVTLTHVADTGLLLNSDMEFQFRDSALTIRSSADGQLDIDADVELQITAPTVDINASTLVDISSACTVGGNMKVSNLTDNQLVLAGTSGLLEGSSNLTYDGETITLADDVAIGQTSADVISFSASVSSHFIPEEDNVKDLGSASKRWANVYTGDLHLSNDRGNWTLVEEENMLTFRNNLNGKWYRMHMEEIDSTGRDSGMQGPAPSLADSSPEWEIEL